MRKFLLAAALALPFTVLVVSKASAGCCCPPPPVTKVGISFGICWRTWCGHDCCGAASAGGRAGPGSGPVTAGPWYTYYPYTGNSLTPAPTGYPYWPSPQTSGPMFGGNYQAPPQNPGFSLYPAGPVQPCGYYQAPSYWYGR
jgi:hypothetical protein